MKWKHWKILVLVCLPHSPPKFAISPRSNSMLSLLMPVAVSWRRNLKNNVPAREKLESNSGNRCELLNIDLRMRKYFCRRENLDREKKSDKYLKNAAEYGKVKSAKVARKPTMCIINKSELVACANHEIDELRFGWKSLRNRFHYVIMWHST